MCPSVLRLSDCFIVYYYQCKFKYSSNMLTLEERINITELLSGLSSDDVLSLASTVTKGLLKPSSREEATEAILLHSDTMESILSRKKISRELIFSYLNWKKLTTDSNLDKKSLMKLLTNYWQEQLPSIVNATPVSAVNKTPARADDGLNVTQNNKCNNQLVIQDNSQLVSYQLAPGQVDLLAHKFTEWFYQLLNKDFLEGGSFALGPENFWNDASLHMQMNSNGEMLSEEAEGSIAIVKLISETKLRHKLYFSPNLSAEGVRGRCEPHGMVCVLVCGTLHQSAGVVVGLFEQTFYLIKDPLTNNTWKIKRSQLVLTSKTNIAALPTLTEGTLTRELLPIENPD